MSSSYPIYSMRAKWQYKSDNQLENNSTSSDWMEREKLSDQQLLEKTEMFRQSIIAKEKEKGREVVTPIDIECKFMEYETWVLRWFSHLTFNLFETEEKAFDDFQDFVDRKMRENLKHGHMETNPIIGNEKPYHCLMGAEDRWRWNICGCDICKQDGTTIINH